MAMDELELLKRTGIMSLKILEHIRLKIYME